MFVNESVNKDFCHCETDFGDGITKSGCDTLIHRYDAEGNYRIKLYIERASGCNDTFSRPITVTGITGIKEIQQQENFNVHLLNNRLVVKNLTDNNMPYTVAVYTLQGQLVLYKALSAETESVNFTPYKNGLYLVQINAQQHSVTSKIVKY